MSDDVLERIANHPLIMINYFYQTQEGVNEVNASPSDKGEVRTDGRDSNRVIIWNSFCNHCANCIFE